MKTRAAQTVLKHAYMTIARLINSTKQSLFWKAKHLLSQSVSSTHVMEHKSSLMPSWKLTRSLYPKPDQSSPRPPTWFL